MNTRVQDNLPRTNNNLEGWHNRFSSMFTHAHPSIWTFLDILNRESSYNHLTMAQILAGAVPPPQKRPYREVNNRLQSLVQGYNSNNVINFLRGISFNLALQ